MASEFSGRTADSYRRFRRDVAGAAVDLLARAANWSAQARVIDLGCGSGQLAIPLAPKVGAILACDVEPDQLKQLHSRLVDDAVANVVPCLVSDRTLPALGAALGSARAAGLVVANAVHWMDEQALLAGLPSVVEPEGVFAIVTHGPPLWLGGANWQVEVREVVEQLIGPVSTTCGADEATLISRVDALRAAGLQVEVQRHQAGYEVDGNWVVGHLLSAMSTDRNADEKVGELDQRIKKVVPPGSIELIATTIITAKLPRA